MRWVAAGDFLSRSRRKDRGASLREAISVTLTRASRGLSRWRGALGLIGHRGVVDQTDHYALIATF
jgi:hypothetical protein